MPGNEAQGVLHFPYSLARPLAGRFVVLRAVGPRRPALAHTVAVGDGTHATRNGGHHHPGWPAMGCIADVAPDLLA